MMVNGISLITMVRPMMFCILVEANLPRVVAEDRDGRTTGRADFFGQKETALDRLETESLKVARCHKLSKQTLGSGVFSQGEHQWRRKAANAAEGGIPGSDSPSGSDRRSAEDCRTASGPSHPSYTGRRDAKGQTRGADAEGWYSPP